MERVPGQLQRGWERRPPAHRLRRRRGLLLRRSRGGVVVRWRRVLCRRRGGLRCHGRHVFVDLRHFVVPRLLLVLTVLRCRCGTSARVFAHAGGLEFSQSFQVLAILASTLAHAVVFVFGLWFWVGAGLPAARAARGAPMVLACQLVLLGCNLFCHAGVLWMHFGGAIAGGCSARHRGLGVQHAAQQKKFTRAPAAAAARCRRRMGSRARCGT